MEKPRQLPSGRWQGRYVGTDGKRHTLSRTFLTEADAKRELRRVAKEISRGEWHLSTPEPVVAVLTFGDYAERWLAERTLKPKSRDIYRRLLDQRLLPTLGKRSLTEIRPADVRTWHSAQPVSTKSQNAAAYSLLRTIYNTAVQDELVVSNPCLIRGATSNRRIKRIRVLEHSEVEALADIVPPRYRAMVIVAAYSCLRIGELTALRRSDVVRAGDEVSLSVTKSVARLNGTWVLGTPKTEAGQRHVILPEAVVPVLAKHMLAYSEPGEDGLLFPAVRGGYLTHGSASKVLQTACTKLGIEDMRWHGFRHTGAVHYAEAGATGAELKALLGHESAQTSQIYLHARSKGLSDLAQRMSKAVSAQ